MYLLSLLRNDEVNAVILGRDFATKTEVMFGEDLMESNRSALKRQANGFNGPLLI